MPITYSRSFTFREISPGRWGAFVGFQLVAEGPSEEAVRQLVMDRHR